MQLHRTQLNSQKWAIKSNGVFCGYPMARKIAFSRVCRKYFLSTVQ